MKKSEDISAWIVSAKSDFAVAKKGKFSKDVQYETPCFHAQQTAEKSIKAILIHHNIPFQKTHNIELLFKLLEKSEINIPKIIKPATELTKYAVTTRYPDDFDMQDKIDKKEYKHAVALAAKVLEWAKKIIQQDKRKLF